MVKAVNNSIMDHLLDSYLDISGTFERGSPPLLLILHISPYHQSPSILGITLPNPRITSNLHWRHKLYRRTCYQCHHKGQRTWSLIIPWAHQWRTKFGVSRCHFPVRWWQKYFAIFSPMGLMLRLGKCFLTCLLWCTSWMMSFYTKNSPVFIIDAQELTVYFFDTNPPFTTFVQKL